MTPPKGVVAKLARAAEHRDALNREFDSFMQPEANTPWAVVIEFNFDVGECRIVWHQATETPLRWSVILGEFLHNVRSALDHLARELVIANGGKPSRDTAFPVYDTEDNFKGGAGSKIAGMETDAKAVIQELQPFNEWPEHPRQTTLWQINDLRNIDTHRLLHLSDPWVFSAQFRFVLPGNVAQDLIRPVVPPRRQRLYDKTVIAAFEWDPGDMRGLGEQDVKMEFDLSLDVALAEGDWVDKRGNPTGGMALRHLMNVALDYMSTTVLPKVDPFLI